MTHHPLAAAVVAATGLTMAVTMTATSPSVAAPSTRASSSPSTSPSTLPPSSSSSGAGLVLVAKRRSLLGTHTWYRQTYRGLPVLGGYYATHVVSGRRTVDDGRVAVPAGLAVSPQVSGSSAERTAKSRLEAAAKQRPPSGKGAPVAATAPAVQQARLAVVGGSSARLVWRVVGTGARGSTESVVDARSGAVVRQRSLVKNDVGRGRVFNPNPVVALRNEHLQDRNDADQDDLVPAYKNVPLSFLDGSGFLRGSFAQILNGNAVRSTREDFRYSRHPEGFEQVSAYFDITEAQKYLRSLGFRDVNNDSQKVFTNTIPDDNSFYDPEVDEITFGRGGVDDAEDQEVVWHELGHAIQDSQVPGFGSSEQGGAIGEGFGDYWAVTMSEPVSKGFDLPCVMDWDSTSYTSGPRHCLRRTDGTKTTRDIDGEVHDDGEIWSRALWDIHRLLGRTKADRVIIESQFGYAPNTSFTKAANQVVQTARVMYGDGAADDAREAFLGRRILK